MKNIKIDNTVTITPEMLWEKFQEKLSAAGFDKVDNIAHCQEVNAGEITAAVETTQALTWNNISRPRFVYVDTGAMYRTVAVYAKRAGLRPEEVPVHLPIDIKMGRQEVGHKKNRGPTETSSLCSFSAGPHFAYYFAN